MQTIRRRTSWIQELRYEFGSNKFFLLSTLDHPKIMNSKITKHTHCFHLDIPNS